MSRKNDAIRPPLSPSETIPILRALPATVARTICSYINGRGVRTQREAAWRHSIHIFSRGIELLAARLRRGTSDDKTKYHIPGISASLTASTVTVVDWPYKASSYRQCTDRDTCTAASVLTEAGHRNIGQKM